MGVFDKFSGIGVASGFKLQAKAPLDVRQVVDTIDDRNALITENGAYEGMQVYVKADKKTYVLKDLTAGTWEELGAGGGGSAVQADYNQSDSTQPDYIKNRPFYEDTESAFREVYNETLTFEKKDDSELYNGSKEMVGEFPLDGINPGDTMSVTFNGTEYSCVVEKFEENEITGIQFGNASLIPDSSGKDTGEPFVSVYYSAPTAGSVIEFLTTIQSTSIQVIIKAVKTTTVIKTIDPKYIKDMYYETTSETEVYSGTLTTTKSGSSYTASLPLAYGWFPTDVATAKITIDGVTQFLPVTQDNDNQLCLIGGLSVDDYGVGILTSGESTSIFTKEQYSNVLLTISSYEDYIKKVPSKYLSIGFEIDVSVESITNDNIAEALKTYLTNNAEDLTTLTTSETFQLNVSSGSTVSYIYRQGYITANSSELRFFCNYINPEDLFDAYTYTEGYVLIIKTSGGVVSTVTIKHTSILSSLPAWVFKVADIEENGDLNFGLLGILHLNKGTSMYEDFNGLVALHDWITKAQKRDDFQIPAPTKETDLVDKKYADSLVSGGSSLSIELAVGKDETTEDVFKTYLNNNASVLTQLEAASSFTLKVVKTTSVTTLTTTYTFAKNYTNTFTGAQYHFVCVYGTGETTVEGTVLWFSVSDSAVSDLKLTTYDFARITYNHCISITDGSTYSLKFIFPSKSATLVTTQAQLTTLIGNSELPASGWALVDSVYYTIGFIKNNSYCYYGNAKEPTWHSLGEYTITDTLL